MCSFFSIFRFAVLKLFIIFYYISLYLVTIDNAVFVSLLFTNALLYSFCPSLARFVSCFVPVISSYRVAVSLLHLFLSPA